MLKNTRCFKHLIYAPLRIPTVCHFCSSSLTLLKHTLGSLQPNHAKWEDTHAAYVLDQSISQDQLNILLDSEIKEATFNERLELIKELCPLLRTSHVAKTLVSSIVSRTNVFQESLKSFRCLSNSINSSTPGLYYIQPHAWEDSPSDLLMREWYRTLCNLFKKKKRLLGNSEESLIIDFVRLARWIPRSCDIPELQRILNRQSAPSVDIIIWRSQFYDEQNKSWMEDVRRCSFFKCRETHPFELVEVLQTNQLKDEAIHISREVCSAISQHLQPSQKRTKNNKQLDPRDLAHILPGLKSLLHSHIMQNEEAYQIFKDVWELLLIPNLDALPSAQILNSLDLIVRYRRFFVRMITSGGDSEEIQRKYKWIEVNLEMISKICLSRNLDLHGIQRLLDILFIPKSFTCFKTALVELGISYDDILKSISNSIEFSPFISPIKETFKSPIKETFIDFQLERLSTSEILSLSSKIGQLRSSDQPNSISDLFDSTVEILSDATLRGGKDNYIDCLDVGLQIDPLKYVTLWNTLLSILTDVRIIQILGERLRHYVLCRISSRSQWKNSDLGQAIFESYKNVRCSSSGGGLNFWHSFILEDLMELSAVSSDEAWNIFCDWSCVPLMNQLRSAKPKLDHMMRFLLSVPRLSSRLSIACQSWPMSDLPGVLAIALTQSTAEYSTLIDAVKLVKVLPLYSSGTFADNLIRQINWCRKLTSDQYDRIMFELLKSGVSDTTLLFNWVDSRVIISLESPITNEKDLLQWISQIEQLGISTPSLCKVFNAPCPSTSSPSLKIGWSYANVLLNQPTQSLMYWNLLTSLSEHENLSLLSTDALRLYYIHIHFSLKLRNQWTDLVKSNHTVCQFLNDIPLLAWIKQQQGLLESFVKSKYFPVINESLTRLASTESTSLRGRKFQSEMKDVMFAEFFSECPSFPIAIMCIVPNDRYRIMYNSAMVEYPYDLFLPMHIDQNKKQIISNEITPPEFLKLATKRRKKHLQDEGWNVVIIDLEVLGLHTTDEDRDRYLLKCFDQHLIEDS